MLLLQEVLLLVCGRPPSGLPGRWGPASLSPVGRVRRRGSIPTATVAAVDSPADFAFGDLKARRVHPAPWRSPDGPGEVGPVGLRAAASRCFGFLGLTVGARGTRLTRSCRSPGPADYLAHPPQNKGWLAPDSVTSDWVIVWFDARVVLPNTEELKRGDLLTSDYPRIDTHPSRDPLLTQYRFGSLSEKGPTKPRRAPGDAAVPRPLPPTHPRREEPRPPESRRPLSDPGRRRRHRRRRLSLS